MWCSLINEVNRKFYPNYYKKDHQKPKNSIPMPKSLLFKAFDIVESHFKTTEFNEYGIKNNNIIFRNYLVGNKDTKLNHYLHPSEEESNSLHQLLHIRAKKFF